MQTAPASGIREAGAGLSGLNGRLGLRRVAAPQAMTFTVRNCVPAPPHKDDFDIRHKAYFSHKRKPKSTEKTPEKRRKMVIWFLMPDDRRTILVCKLSLFFQCDVGSITLLGKREKHEV